MRIAKFIANAGICSRREAERLIEQGKVIVDGQLITSPALNIDESNSVSVNGKEIKHLPDIRLWVYYKPVGLVVPISRNVHNSSSPSGLASQYQNGDAWRRTTAEHALHALRRVHVVVGAARGRLA